MKTILNRCGDLVVPALFLILIGGGVQRAFDAEAQLPFAHVARR